MQNKFFVLIILSSCLISAKKKCHESFGHSDLENQLKGLNYERFYFASEEKLKDKLNYYQFQEMVTPVTAPKNKELLIPIHNIHFMQHNCRYRSRPKNGGYSVLENARRLKDGSIQIIDIPPIHIWRDSTGKIWTLNHRRLAAYVLSGSVKKAYVVWVDPEEVLLPKNLDKWDPYKEGRYLEIIDPTNGYAIIIKQPKKF